jgi:hypothetical protein
MEFPPEGVFAEQQRLMVKLAGATLTQGDGKMNMRLKKIHSRKTGYSWHTQDGDGKIRIEISTGGGRISIVLS